MKVWSKRQQDVVVLAVQGRLDAATAPLFEEQVLPMISAGDKNFLLDLAGLDYISSAALRRLLFFAKRAEDQGGRVVLLSVQNHILEILDMAGFTQLFAIFADQDEALRSF
ncbi:MAG: STAS domain-containing protein [Smithellaceae bacterium]|nr:STAS domain-containing protein [Smithellaceae bacterium]MDD3260013.1 STAS domain-containing protein [Smithellaceae bacterium]MDD3848448.1 STAS domain-containing protein [Smithellaceae bacterium]HOG12942.1 STAS domain-containing protein [Smithellaceae bacterium]HPL09908.1 STAS domain-containing protein [Smithellaceae bacterium]